VAISTARWPGRGGQPVDGALLGAARLAALLAAEDEFVFNGHRHRGLPSLASLSSSIGMAPNSRAVASGLEANHAWK
jgi:hypothetical protein